MSMAFVPSVLSDLQTAGKTNSRLRDDALSVVIGILILAATAQISIPLPFTPVPITGQTFGVALIALLWGRNRGLAAVAGYLALGAVGLPIFAHASSGLTFGPTLGYLIGMFVASIAMGSLADRGWTKTFKGTYAAAFLGSVITFTFGLAILSLFVPREALLISGLLPFIPGDIVKTLAACAIVRSSHVAHARRK